LKLEVEAFLGHFLNRRGRRHENFFPIGPPAIDRDTIHKRGNIFVFRMRRRYKVGETEIMIMGCGASGLGQFAAPRHCQPRAARRESTVKAKEIE
jgi:hypothetical protein